MDGIKFFDEHPDYRYAVLDWYIQSKIGRLWNFYAQIPPFVLNELVKKEFHSDEGAFAAYLFHVVNLRQIQLTQLQQENIALRNELKRYQTAQ